MLLTDPFPPELAARWTARVPIESDVDAVAELILADDRRYDPDASVDRAHLASRMVGLRSWSRRQIVIVPVGRTPGRPVAWVSCVDRSPGLVDVQWVVDPEVAERDALVGALLDWVVQVGGAFARHRGLDETLIDADCHEDDVDRQRLLASHGFAKVRTWLHMERPIAPEDVDARGPREGVRVRRVETHPGSGLPIAHDVRTVHRMLEESFQDHFSSYRESFAEFAARLTEGPESAWDHWWIAEVLQDDGTWWPGGGLVSVAQAATAHKGEGTYLEYLGVHRSARGRGVAKALLNAAVRDAAERGRTRVGLEVDADSPTGADGLYESMGWRTYERTQSWHTTVPAQESRLIEAD